MGRAQFNSSLWIVKPLEALESEIVSGSHFTCQLELVVGLHSSGRVHSLSRSLSFSLVLVLVLVPLTKRGQPLINGYIFIHSKSFIIGPNSTKPNSTSFGFILSKRNNWPPESKSALVSNLAFDYSKNCHLLLFSPLSNDN